MKSHQTISKQAAVAAAETAEAAAETVNVVTMPT